MLKTNSYFLLLLTFVVFGYTHCLTSDPKYEVKSEFSLGSIQSGPYEIHDFYTDFCNKGYAKTITLRKSAIETTIPVILYLHTNESQNLNETDCVVRVEMSTSSKNGLIVAMDDIHIGSHDNETCSDYVLIQGSNSTATKWCRNKTDISGIEFPGQSHVDIGFHAANSSNSSFTLIVTQFEAPSFGYCFSNNNTKCSSPDGKQCISNAYQCDGHRNCPEGDDENGCPLTPTTTITPTHHTTSSATPSTIPYTTHQTTYPTYVPPYPIPTPKPPGPSGGLIALLVMVSLIVVLISVFVILKGLKKRRDHSGYSVIKNPLF